MRPSVKAIPPQVVMPKPKSINATMQGTLCKAFKNQSESLTIPPNVLVTPFAASLCTVDSETTRTDHNTTETRYITPTATM